MKKLLFIIILLFFSCDSEMKRCTYDVYQFGRKLPDGHIKYIRISEWCESYAQDGVIYKLKDVDTVKVKDIKK